MDNTLLLVAIILLSQGMPIYSYFFVDPIVPRPRGPAWGPPWASG